ncbi:MAG: hypothetical protein JWM56_310 [Candidatus Peribacteria bacterium]|nr:hypothetical protein [Candidatus Peribacteria bacterium]
MAVTLNTSAFEYAKDLIAEKKVVRDNKDAWSEHQPTPEQENTFIEDYGFDAYAKWHLGIDRNEHEEVKGKYKFPYGDFQKVHRCGVLAAESRAGQYRYPDIKAAAAHLHGMLEGVSVS